MKKMLKRLCTGFLALATVVTVLPTTPVHPFMQKVSNTGRSQKNVSVSLKK